MWCQIGCFSLVLLRSSQASTCVVFFYSTTTSTLARFQVFWWRGRTGWERDKGLCYSMAIQFHSIQFHLIKLNLIWFDLIWFDLIQCHAIQFNSIQFHSIQFKSIQYTFSTLAALYPGIEHAHWFTDFGACIILIQIHKCRPWFKPRFYINLLCSLWLPALCVQPEWGRELSFI